MLADRVSGCLSLASPWSLRTVIEWRRENSGVSPSPYQGANPPCPPPDLVSPQPPPMGPPANPPRRGLGPGRVGRGAFSAQRQADLLLRSPEEATRVRAVSATEASRRRQFSVCISSMALLFQQTK